MERINLLTRRLTLCAVLVAAALVLSLAERWIPPLVPVPGIKPGFSNIALLVALYMLGAVPSLWVIVGKCVLGAVFAGSVVSGAYSLAGGVLAWAVMCLALRMKKLSPVGVSILGAAAHVTGQIAMSMAVLGTWVTVSYLPVLLALSVVTGTVTGLISTWTLMGLKKMK